MTVTEFLQSRVPVLAGLSAGEARDLAEAAGQEQFSSGQTVLFKGTAVGGLHVLADGAATVWARPSKTRPPLAVAELRPGEVFGEMSLFGEELAGATVKAAQDGTLVLVLSREALDPVLAAHPDIRTRIDALIALRRGAVPA